MQEPIESKEYHGYAVQVFGDDTGESPDAWGDKNLFLVGFHRDFSVERAGFGKAEACAIYPDADYYDKETAARILKQYHVFGLEAYIHGGVALALVGEGNFPDRGWDVSSVGAVFVAKTEAKSRAAARKHAEGLIKTWNLYLEGSVYGYRAIAPDGREVGSVWGFYGDPEESGLMESAREEIDADIREGKIDKPISAENFAVGEFKIIEKPGKVWLEIDGKHIVAQADKDNARKYKEIFDFAVKTLGGRIDGR